MGRRALVLLVALILAGVAAFSVYMFVSGIEDEVREGREEVVVFRATQAVPEGQDGDLFLQTPMWEQSIDQMEDVPAGFIRSEEELRAVIGGKVAVGPIAENQILTTDQWVELTTDITPLAELIPSGKQAITVSTDQVRGVNGFIRPGDRINAILTIDIEFDLLPEQAPGFGIPSGEEGETAQPEEETEVVTLSRYVLQGIPVLAVDRDVRPQEGERQEVSVTPEGGTAEGGETAPATVFTLEVDAEQAEKFVYAFENGSVWLTLVPEDFVEVETRGVTIENLFEGDLVQDIFGG
ncbi:MAG: Flp pilus assembly protein CpaB [Actinomycetes bacterium]|jgi:pilus assembly protein CpaB|nr:Flp pilus assembly protein CpaB [Acidimicrobiia bacterium]